MIGWIFAYVGCDECGDTTYKALQIYDKKYEIEKGDIVECDDMNNIVNDCLLYGIPINIINEKF